jgi:hypothetical protein
MREKGWDIPMIPVDIIDAENETDAKKKLLAITSQYGEFDLTGYMEFTDGIEIDDTIRLTDGDWNINNNNKQETTDKEREAIKYLEKNEIIVQCNDKHHHQELYEEFQERGIKCKILTL